MLYPIQGFEQQRFRNQPSIFSGIHFKERHMHIPILPKELTHLLDPNTCDVSYLTPVPISFIQPKPWRWIIFDNDTFQISKKGIPKLAELELLSSSPTIDLTENRRLANADNRIVFFTTPNGNKFILKQTKPSAVPGHHYSLVLEYVGNRVAEEQHIPANLVRIIPPNLPFPLKVYPNQAATLHTLIEGESIKDADIRQNGGLTIQTIRNMARHPNLAQIAALDTFMGNPDRGWWNMIYVPAIDTFVSFDMGDSFSRKLASDAIRDLKAMRSAGIQFTPWEIEGLKIYRNTLHKLVSNYPTQTILRYLDEGTAKAGFKEAGLPFYQESTEKWFKKIAQENIADSLELLKLLDNIITKYRLNPGSILQVTSDRVRLHSKPDHASPVSIVLNRCTGIKTLGPVEKNWAQVEAEGNVGWINTKDTTYPLEPLADEMLAPDTLLEITADSGLRLRDTPTTAGSILDVLAKGTKVKALGPISKGWIKVDSDGTTGWLSKEYTKIIKLAKPKAATADDHIATGTKLIITSDGLNLRSGPDTDSRIITSLPKDTELTVVGSKIQNGWVNVTSGGFTGWVNKSFTE